MIRNRNCIFLSWASHRGCHRV